MHGHPSKFARLDSNSGIIRLFCVHGQHISQTITESENFDLHKSITDAEDKHKEKLAFWQLEPYHLGLG